MRFLVPAAAALFCAVSLAPLPARADSLAGSYLAASQASFENDYAAAAEYYARALAADPDNTDLMQNALLSFLSKGDPGQALEIARRMESVEAGSQLAQLVILTDDIRQGRFAEASAYFNGENGFSPLLDGLLQGWILFGLGQMSDALARFDEMAENNAMKIFSDYHKALALAAVGDFEGAAVIFDGVDGQHLRIGRGSLIAHIKVLSQLDRRDDALAMIDEALNGSGDLEILALRDRVSAGETLAFDNVTTPQEGAAEVFLTLAAVLAGEDNERFGLIYGRLSEFLRPEAVEAILLVADLLNSHRQYDLAVRNFNKVPSDHPGFYSAEIGRAEALQADGRADAAIEVLRGLAKTHKTIPTVFTSLGDALRRQSKFAEATEAYAAAIALLPEPQPNHWFLYYARGITYEREGKWDEAEADFRFALKLSPDQPLVLNYLGYGLVEKRIKYDEAQKMIEIAVQQRPNDGYITDSLGWVLYRIGKFDEAVAPMERAVELMPVDPIINDHLGDVYWMVGRQLEARFQWRRALSFKPEEDEALRIRKKLEIGLDEVLKSEAENGTGND
ncbi:MAG: tetratricopeptide repeat protein [Rhodobacteraceae bacterium]|nr:tetratricopeptide repeat protein [Paracoccaceae bacterium]